MNVCAHTNVVETSFGDACIDCMCRGDVLAVAMAILGEPCRVLYDAHKPRIGGFVFRRAAGFYVANFDDATNLVLRAFLAKSNGKNKGQAVRAWLASLTLRLDLARAVAEKGCAL